jgi:hypothetical protein
MVCAERLGAKQEVAISIPARRTFLVVIMVAFFHGERMGRNLRGLEILDGRLSPASERIKWDSCTK